MSRRHYRSSITFNRTEDPGKDLYAYLYLITVVSFIMFVTAGKIQDAVSKSVAPERKTVSTRSTLASVSNRKLGRLVKQDSRIYLKFERKLYDPVRDIEQMKKDGRLSWTNSSDGKKKKVLYLEEAQTSRIWLSEYLSAFQQFSKFGIGIAFAERVK